MTAWLSRGEQSGRGATRRPLPCARPCQTRVATWPPLQFVRGTSSEKGAQRPPSRQEWHQGCAEAGGHQRRAVRPHLLRLRVAMRPLARAPSHSSQSLCDSDPSGTSCHRRRPRPARQTRRVGSLCRSGPSLTSTARRSGAAGAPWPLQQRTGRRALTTGRRCAVTRR